MMETSVNNQQPTENNNIKPIKSHRLFLIKLFILSLCFITDIALNSLAEYEDFTSVPKTESSSSSSKMNGKHLHLLLTAMQVFSQISAFSCLFLLFCDTFPFQIGLLDLLAKRFSTVLCFHVVYFGLTCLICGLRMTKINNDVHMVEIWESDSYTAISFLQKIVAPFYYAQNIQAVLELGSSKYFSKDGWLMTHMA